MKVNYPYFQTEFDKGSGVTDLLIYFLKNRNLKKAKELADYIKEASENKEVNKSAERQFYGGFRNPFEVHPLSIDRAMNFYYKYATISPVIPTDVVDQYITPEENEKALKIISDENKSLLDYFAIQENPANRYENFSNKLVDENGIPIVFYHGVRNFYPNFRSQAMGDGVKIPFGNFEPESFPATYFSPDLEYTMFYAGIAPNMPTPTTNYFGYIYRVVIKMVNPLDLRPLGFENSFKNYKDYIYLLTGLEIENPNPRAIDEKKTIPIWSFTRLLNKGIEKLKINGVDGIIQIGDIPVFNDNEQIIEDRNQWRKGDEYLTFYSDQVINLPFNNASRSIGQAAKIIKLKDSRFYKKGGYVSVR